MKGRKHRGTGGVNEAEEDLKDKPEARTNAKKVDSEAEERKHGGRAKRRHGGKAEMKVEGHAMHHAGRKPRKSGGRAGGSNSNPFSSARSGKNPPGHSTQAASE